MANYNKYEDYFNAVQLMLREYGKKYVEIQAAIKESSLEANFDIEVIEEHIDALKLLDKDFYSELKLTLKI